MCVNMQRVGLVVALMAVACGCGALTHGRRQRVRVMSVPPGAAVSVDGYECVSPCTVMLTRDCDHTVRIEMHGFQPRERKVRRVVDRTVLLGNCVFFLCVPQIWEHGSPLQYRLEPAEIDVNLEPLRWSPR